MVIGYYGPGMERREAGLEARKTAKDIYGEGAEDRNGSKGVEGREGCRWQTICWLLFHPKFN